MTPSGTPAKRMPSIARGKVGRIVEPCIGGITKAVDGASWIERKPRLCGGSRLIQRAEQREGGCERKMREDIISVGFDAACAEPGSA